MVKLEYALALTLALFGAGAVGSLGQGYAHAIHGGTTARDVAHPRAALVTSRQAAIVPVRGLEAAATAAHAIAPAEFLSQTFASLAHRVAIIGDVHGHPKAFARILRGLGADVERGILPRDLTVIQAGDLVHKGPDTNGVLDIVARFLVNEPERWVQILGNHEARYLGGPGFLPFNANLDEAAVKRLQSWYENGQLRIAAAIARPDVPEGILVSHAGLTSGMWHDIGAPTSAVDAANALNKLAHTDPDATFRSGHALSGYPRSTSTGPVWADSGQEVVLSWMDLDAPFHQVHGHSNAYRYDRREWRLPKEFQGERLVDAEKKHEFVKVGGRWLVGTDPKNVREASSTWDALVLPGAQVVTSKVSAKDVGVTHQQRKARAILEEIAEIEAQR